MGTLPFTYLLPLRESPCGRTAQGDRRPRPDGRKARACSPLESLTSFILTITVEAAPLLPGHRPVGHAGFEHVAPGLAARRAAVRLLPVGVRVPSGEPTGLNLSSPAGIACGPLSCTAVRPRRGRVESEQTAAVVVNGSVLAVEPHVDAKEELVAFDMAEEGASRLRRATERMQR